MQDFRNLKVWSCAHHVTIDVYAVTRQFPRDEMFGITAQMRRASASIGANIAEGCGRTGDAELARFLQIAMGSASELEYHLLLARDLEFLTPGDYRRLALQTVEVKRMAARLIRSLKPGTASNPSGTRVRGERGTERLKD